MVKTEREIKEIISRYAVELEKLGITSQRILLYGSYAKRIAREDSDIDLLLISERFEGMNIRERLELLGIAAGKVFEPIEAFGYTPEEIDANKRGTFLEEVLEQIHL
ncbi:MAG TPA: nucleotidyltransferase domain-containing protein [Thermodesulfovibrionales bacterium]|jgi:predicted nucleotidyltransferase|nr:nucleotidyltransferase domain-containing protein [Thermodesulfovibrionales bacterium]